MNKIELYGPKLWSLIHYFSAHYDCRYFPWFIDCLRYLIPCEGCRKHFSDNLRVIPFSDFAPDSVFLWSYVVHAKVNKLLYKKTPPYATARAAFVQAPETLMDDYWYLLYTFAANITPSGVQYYKSFVDVTVGMLPNKKRLKTIIKRNPPCTFPSTPHGLFLWTYTIHQLYSPDESYDTKKSRFYAKCEQCTVVNLNGPTIERTNEHII